TAIGNNDISKAELHFVDICFPINDKKRNKYYRLRIPEWYFKYKAGDLTYKYIGEYLDSLITDVDLKYFLYPFDPDANLDLLQTDPSKLEYVIEHPDLFLDFDILNLYYLNIPADYCPSFEPCHFPQVCKCQQKITTMSDD